MKPQTHVSIPGGVFSIRADWIVSKTRKYYISGVRKLRANLLRDVRCLSALTFFAAFVVVCQPEAITEGAEPGDQSRFVFQASIAGAVRDGGCFSADGKRIVTCRGSFNSSLVQVWNAETAKPISKPMPQSAISFLAFADGNSKLMIADKSNIAYWNVDTSAEVSSVHVSDGRMFDLSVSDDRRKFVVNERERPMSLWNAGGTRPILILPRHVIDAAFDGSGKLLITRATRRDDPSSIFQFWDTEKGVEMAHPVATDLGLSTSGAVAAFNGDGKHVALLQDRGIIVVDVETGRTLSSATLPKVNVAEVFDNGSGPKVYHDLETPSRRMSQIAWNKSRNIILTVTELWPYELDLGDDQIQIWDGSMLKILRTLHASPLFAMMAPNGKWILIIPDNEKGKPEIWSVDTGEQIQEFDLKGYMTAAISPDSETIAFGKINIDGTAETSLWRAGDAKRGGK